MRLATATGDLNGYFLPTPVLLHPPFYFLLSSKVGIDLVTAVYPSQDKSLSAVRSQKDRATSTWTFLLYTFLLLVRLISLFFPARPGLTQSTPIAVHSLTFPFSIDTLCDKLLSTCAQQRRFFNPLTTHILLPCARSWPRTRNKQQSRWPKKSARLATSSESRSQSCQLSTLTCKSHQRAWASRFLQLSTFGESRRLATTDSFQLLFADDFFDAQCLDQLELIRHSVQQMDPRYPQLPYVRPAQSSNHLADATCD